MRGLMTNIKILGWVHVVLNGLLLAAGLLLCVALMLSADKGSRAGEMILPLFATMALWLLVPGLVGGIGLLYVQPWARILVIVLSVMHLFLIPIGTVLGGFGLWILLGRDAGAAFGDTAVRAAAAAAAREAAVPGSSAQAASNTIGLVLAIAGVGAGFIVVIGAGFMISGDTAPVELINLFYPALGVLVVVLGFGVRAIVQRLRGPRVVSGTRRDYLH
jgi:hypothetical protein